MQGKQLVLAEDIWTIFAPRLPRCSLQRCHFYFYTKCFLKWEYLESTMDGTRAVRKELLRRGINSLQYYNRFTRQQHTPLLYYYYDDDDDLCCCCCGRKFIIIIIIILTNNNSGVVVEEI